jgi:hypothetical protein
MCQQCTITKVQGSSVQTQLSVSHAYASCKEVDPNVDHSSFDRSRARHHAMEVASSV